MLAWVPSTPSCRLEVCSPREPETAPSAPFAAPSPPLQGRRGVQSAEPEGFRGSFQEMSGGRSSFLERLSVRAPEGLPCLGQKAYARNSKFFGVMWQPVM